MGLYKIGSVAFAASGAQNFPFSQAPFKGKDGRHFLRRYIQRVDATTITTGAGSALTQAELYQQALQNLTIEGLGGYVGPRGLDGQDLAATYYHASGRATRWYGNLGDALVAASTTGATRQFQLIYDWGSLGGKPSDYAPSIQALAKDGRINLAFPALNVDVTTFTAANDIILETTEADEARAVPVVVTERQGVQSLDGGNFGSGWLLRAMLKNSGVWLNDDITGIDLMGDGQVLALNLEPDFILGAYGLDATDAFAQTQQHFTNQTGLAATPFYLPIYPFSREETIGRLAYASSWTYTIRGNETAANLTWIVSRAQNLNMHVVADQLAACGCDRKDVDAAIAAPDGLASKTISKLAVSDPRVVGGIPVKLRGAVGQKVKLP